MKYHEIIEDICYIYLHIPHEEILTRKKSNKLQRWWSILFTFIKYLLFNLVYLNKALIKVFSSSASKQLSNKPWLVINSLNTISSLSFIKEEVPECQFVSTYSAPFNNRMGIYPRLSFHQGLWGIYKFFGSYRFLSKRHGKEKVNRIVDILFEAVIAYNGAMKMLEKNSPSMLVFANDHLFKNRALLLAGKNNNIKTVYLQHASVSEYFPPLKYDLSLLEGEDTLDKYRSRNKEISGTVELIGMPKFDDFYSFKAVRQSIRTIGVGGNLLDDNNEVHKLLISLSKRFPDRNIIYRPHPRDIREIDLPAGIMKSDSRAVPEFEFLKELDFLIASHTSTHLEATLLNIESIYYEFGSPPVSDYYGYVRHGMIKKAASMEELIKYIIDFESDPLLYQKAKYYNDVIDTEWDGKSQKLALKLISDLNSNS